MILSNAKNMRLGDRQIDRVYKGGWLVWRLHKGYRWERHSIATDYVVSAAKIKSGVSQKLAVGGKYSCWAASPAGVPSLVSASDGLIHWVKNSQWDNGNSLPADYAYAATTSGIIFNSRSKNDTTKYYATINSRTVLAQTTFNLNIYEVSGNTVQTMGGLIDIVEADNQNAYPANGVQGGYWYVRV